MVEPPAAASSGVAVLEQDVLLATKLHMPHRSLALCHGRG